MQIGNTLLYVTLVFGLLTVVAYASKLNRRFARTFFLLTALGIFLTEGYLITMLLKGRYEVKYVWEFSETAIPWFYKVSGAWAGQEGSFLLWATLTALIGLCVFRKLDKLEKPFMICYTIIMSALIGIVAFKPPFEYHSDDGMAMAIGRGITITKNAKRQEFTIKMPAPPIAKVEVWIDDFHAPAREMRKDGQLELAFSVIGLTHNIHRLDVKSFVDPANKRMLASTSFRTPLSHWATDSITGAVFRPTDGRGLVPSLENYWMVIHPPIMFAGFSSLAVLFCFVMAGMFTRQWSLWTHLARPWAILSATLTGFGLCLGGFWAYETLGWGGFWAWDPVENVAFIPWLGSVALVHCLYIQAASGKIGKTALFLGAFPFVAFLFGTFLTRSGTLAEVSVHSFDGLEHETKRLLIGLVLACFFGFMATLTITQFRNTLFAKRYAVYFAIGVGMLVYALFVPGSYSGRLSYPIAVWILGMFVAVVWAGTRPSPEDADSEHRPHEGKPLVTRREGLIAGVVTIMAIAIFTLFGTSWPWITFLISGKSIKAEQPFYNNALAFPTALVLILAAVVPFLDWHKGDSKRFLNRLLMPWTAAITLAILGFFLAGIRDWIQLTFAVLCFFTITANAWRITELFKRSKITVGGFISHIGVATLVIGMVVSMSYEREAQGLLHNNEPMRIWDYTITRDQNKLIPGSTNDKVMQTVELTFDRGSKKFKAEPEYWERNPSSAEPQKMTRPWIKRGLDNDLYVAINPPDIQYSEASKEIRFKPNEKKNLEGFTIERIGGIEIQGEGEPGSLFISKFRIKLPQTELIAEPALMVMEDGSLKPKPARLDPTLAVAIMNPSPEDSSVGLTFMQVDEVLPVTVFYKPLTVLVWLGAGIMAAGGVLSIRRRTLDSRSLARRS